MAAALQNALRERPNLIVIAATGTLPAPEAIVAAASGRLVVVGVVARTGPKALEVLMKDMGPNRSALAAAFRGACSWRGSAVPAVSGWHRGFAGGGRSRDRDDRSR